MKTLSFDDNHEIVEIKNLKGEVVALYQPYWHTVIIKDYVTGENVIICRTYKGQPIAIAVDIIRFNYDEQYIAVKIYNKFDEIKLIRVN